MGSFFTNYHVRSDSQKDVIRELQPIIGSKAYVSPSTNGWVTVYDETAENDATEMRRVIQGLSGKLASAVFAFQVHDSDILMYWLYGKGSSVDAYSSSEDDVDETKDSSRSSLAGKAGVLLPYCKAGTTREELTTLLVRREGGKRKYAFEEERLAGLAACLGIDKERIGCGFEYYEAGELDNKKGFRRVIRKGGARKSLRNSPEDMAQALREVDKLVAEGKSLQAATAEFGEELLARYFCNIIVDGRVERVRSILQVGGNIHGVDFCGANPLGMASARGNLEIMSMLIEAGAGVNTPDGLGYSPLMKAAERGKTDAVKALIRAGADVNARHRLVNLTTGKVSHDVAALMVAARYEVENVETAQARYRLARSVSEDVSHDKMVVMIARQKKVETLETLIEAGAELNARDRNGYTALMMAAWLARADMVRILLQAGAEVNVRGKDGKTALSLVLKTQNATRIALERIGNPLSESAPQKTADSAAQNTWLVAGLKNSETKREEVIQVLRDAGAKE